VVFKPGSQDEFISITAPEGKTFKQVRVVAATVDKLKIIHAEGAASLPMKEMPGEIKGRFNYDKLKAQAAGVSSPAQFLSWRYNQSHLPTLTRVMTF
jgi:hypothetical protein